MSDTQTPVAWMYRCSHDNSVVLQQEKQDWAESGSGLWTETALYASPQKLTPPDGWDEAVGHAKYVKTKPLPTWTLNQRS